MDEVEVSNDGILNLLWRWFGFEGWKELGTSKRIGAQILYRVLFVAGFAGCIIGYTAVYGEDPPTSSTMRHGAGMVPSLSTDDEFHIHSRFALD